MKPRLSSNRQRLLFALGTLTIFWNFFLRRTTVVSTNPYRITPFTKVILTWTEIKDERMPRYWFYDEHVCPEGQCYFTNNRSLITRANAVLFFPRNLKLNDLPSIRSPSQNYIFFWHESPSQTFFNLSSLPLGFFNLTMTYRSDSNIICPYNCFLKHEETVLSTQELVEFANRSRGILSLTSNCYTSSKREQIGKLSYVSWKSAIVRTGPYSFLSQPSWSLLSGGPYFRVVLTIGSHLIFQQRVLL